MTDREAKNKAVIEQLKAENAKLREKRQKTISMKVATNTGKGSLYGLGQRFPITLAKEQWEVLLSSADYIRGFIKDNPEIV